VYKGESWKEVWVVPISGVKAGHSEHTSQRGLSDVGYLNCLIMCYGHHFRYGRHSHPIRRHIVSEKVRPILSDGSR